MVTVKVSVSKLGVVLHSHEGCKYPHDPNRAHGRSTELHDRIGEAALSKPEGWATLSASEQAQYMASLRLRGRRGKTFWIYGPSRVDGEPQIGSDTFVEVLTANSEVVALPARPSGSIEEACSQIYRDTREFYERIRPQLGTDAFGFRILNGPPLLRPPILFVAYQPGGMAPSGPRQHETWPEVLDYTTVPATPEWRLATSLRRMIGVSLLRRCTALNAIFLRSPSLEYFDKTLRREPGLRSEIEKFCLPRVRQMIHLIEPKLIVVIGFATLNALGTAETALKGPAGRVLVKVGEIEGTRAFATLHLSGAHISDSDRLRIAQCILSAAT